jgi:Protein kinase domain
MLKMAKSGNGAAVRARLAALQASSDAPAEEDSKELLWREFIASGQYGFVHRIKDAVTGKGQAVKVNFVERTTDFSGAWREVDMLTRFQHPYVIRLEKVTTTPPVAIPKKKEHRHEDGKMRQDNVYMLFELGDYDLDETSLPGTPQVLKAHAQCLLALEYLHRHNHVHRDVKPGNLLYFEDTQTCKLIDFGMCKPMYPGVRSHLKAVTSAYRPPEMFLGTRTYGPEVDIWATAMCLIYCLLRKEVDVDDDYTAQSVLELMLELVPCEDLPLEQSKRICPKLKRRGTWAELLENFTAVEGLQDLLSHMLCWQPKMRWSATQCLDHPLFDPWRALITECRQATAVPPLCLQPYTIHVEASPERELMLEQVRGSELLEPRMVFHAMDYIDRYINWRVAQQIPRPDPAVSVLRARTCVYLAFKYFNIMTENVPVDRMFRGINKHDAQQFEELLVRDVMKYCIYRPTLFELTATKDLKAAEARVRAGALEGVRVDMPRLYE